MTTNILWCGGEDIDFPAGNLSIQTTGFRSGWARYALAPTLDNDLHPSMPFPGGAVTSCWLSIHQSQSNNNPWANQRVYGLGLLGTDFLLGLASITASMIWVLVKANGTSLTQLQTMSQTDMSYSAVNRITMCLQCQGVDQ